MRMVTRLSLISAIFVTSGLTAKIANESYKAVVTNDERTHTAHENLKKPNKAAVLEAIVDAANAESDERIQQAGVLEAEDTSKTPKVVRVTTSAGVSPIASVMEKRTVNKAEEFIEKIAHPAEVVMEKNLDFTTENIPIQELTYETKDIFPEFEDITEKPLTYKITLPADGYVKISSEKFYVFNVNGNDKLNCINIADNTYHSIGIPVFTNDVDLTKFALWLPFNDSNIVKYNSETRTIDYSLLESLKDSNEQIPAFKTVGEITFKEVYDFLAGVETGKYQLLEEITI